MNCRVQLFCHRTEEGAGLVSGRTPVQAQTRSQMHRARKLYRRYAAGFRAGCKLGPPPGLDQCESTITKQALLVPDQPRPAGVATENTAGASCKVIRCTIAAPETASTASKDDPQVTINARVIAAAAEKDYCQTPGHHAEPGQPSSGAIDTCQQRQQGEGCKAE